MNQAKPRKKKVKNLQGISTSTSEVVNAQLENTGNQYKLSQYRRLYSEGKISAEEFELLEHNAIMDTFRQLYREEIGWY